MSLRHCAQRTHAAVGLVRTALIELHLSGRLFGSGKHAADHHAMRAGGERLGDIAGIADSTVADDRNTTALECLGDPANGTDLRHTDARDDAGRTDGSRAYAYFYPVRAVLDQIQ